MPIYIALDLETTGFDPNNDQVIEIAAVKFEGQQILETFNTLVNPEVEIPPMVSHITGITAEDVQSAPKFSDIKNSLMAFIGNYPIIGHNIDFDLTFLKAKGLPILNPEYDTYQLAGILLPNLPSYSLDTISRIFKLHHEQKHRALSDAQACFHLFNLLIQKIEALPTEVIVQIQQLVSRHKWTLKDIFLNLTTAEKSDLENKRTEIPAMENSADKSHIDTPLPPELTEFFETNGPLANLVENYEKRHKQKKMAQKIIDAFQKKYHLLIEAGTGTGKTLAYLISACWHANQTGEKIIISTHTNNLQDQIIHKDFPLAQKLFPRIKMAVLKGRKKYFSPLKFEQFKNKPHLEEHEIGAIVKIFCWLKETQSGDLDELNLQNKELSVLDEINCEENNDDGENSSVDYLKIARQKANEAHIIVINHALLLQDSLSDFGILPSAKFLVVDEAHHLDKITTDALTVNLTASILHRPVDLLLHFLRSQENADLNLFNFQEKTAETQELMEILVTQANSAGRAISDTFDVIHNIVAEYLQYNPASLQLVVLKKQMTPEHWNALAENLQIATQILLQLQGNLQKLHYALPQSQNKLLPLLNSLTRNNHSLQQITKISEEQIIWVHKSHDENYHLQSAPLNIREFIHNDLLAHKDSVILTSATLTTDQNFRFFRSELGLGEEFEEVILPSHFSYPDQVKILIPTDLPDASKASNDYLEKSWPILGKLILKNGGRSLVLFTAKKDLSKVFHKLAPELKTQGISLLGQSLSGGRGKIISHFKDEPDKSAIMGTNSFWEGVDILGDALNLLIIQKLPFDPPEDPIAQARGSKYQNPFDEYALPKAILRFKQGFGRLIRSATDTGTVVIMDSRLIQKSYGLHFLASLPAGITVKECSANDLEKYL